MEMERVTEFPLTHLDRRPRKRARLGWDVPQAPKAQVGMLCGQEVGNFTSFASLTAHSDQTTSSSSLFLKGVARNDSPPLREDDKDGHYIFELGENLTSRYRIHSKMGEGTFGQVLECWDREKREMIAIKIVRGIKKYREAAMIEIEMLQQLGKHDKNGNRCVQLRNWFDYRNHICIVFEKLGPSLYDFLRKNNYRSFPIDLVREIGRQLLECVAFMHDLHLIHTDLKPENILLVSPEYVKVPDYKSSSRSPRDSSYFKRVPKSSAVKVIDFGSTTYERQDQNYIVSTRHYRAPEVILGLGWSYPCDIWSVGCILVELCTGEALFQTHENLEHLAMMERVMGLLPQHMLRRVNRHAEKYVRKCRLDWPEGATSRESIKAVQKLPRLQNLIMQHVDHSAGDLIHLLQGLLKYDPSDRLSAREALRHPFFSRDHLRREIVKTHDIAFSNRPKTTASDIIAYGSNDLGFSPYGEFWRQIRKICVLELLSLRRVQQFQYVREEEGAILNNRIRSSTNHGYNGTPIINLSEMLMETSNNIVFRCIVGRRSSAEEGGGRWYAELSRRVTMQFMAFSVGDFFPSLTWIDHLRGFTASLRSTSKALHDFSNNVVEEHKATMIGTNVKDFVDILLKLQKESINDFELTKDNVKAILQDMLVAGTETTSTTLEWLTAELMKNPRVMKKAQEELRRTVRNKAKIDTNDVSQMNYLKCIVKENMRLHPAAPLLVARETRESVENLGGYHIPAKTRVFINAWAIQRSPSSWDKPEEFIPERFENSSVDFKGQDPQLVPFGFGRRGCPGLTFAIAGIEYVIANLLSWFDWKLPGGDGVMLAEELDMSEGFGLTVYKKVPLHLVPISDSP
ncbi:hypothetical protein TIFTF001_027693 [Ficus carica]|uniref:dual-specificity kinase n=1 Tax=Ficus carica TaxID=3494 RepID=A0AA88DNW6_FICCA|nr:hypothetical protein TIFTF001_027693 [Ficus carica]